MSKKTIMYAVAVVSLLLLVLATVVYFMTGDTTAAGTVGAGAAAASAEALRRRQQARKTVEVAKIDTTASADRVAAIHSEAGKTMQAEEKAVEAATDSEKIASGNDLLG